MAHRIVWASVATIDPSDRPRSRILHPIWEWDGTTLEGWTPRRLRVMPGSVMTTGSGELLTRSADTE